MYLIIIYIILSIFVAFGIILYLLSNQKYILINESIVKKESEKLYKNDFPNKTIKDIEREIEIIADKLIDNQETNRYTERLREKAEKDYKIKILQKLCLENAKIVNYKNKKMKAKVKFRDFNEEYYMLMDMKVVSRGRIFLNSYKILKNRIRIKKETF